MKNTMVMLLEAINFDEVMVTGESNGEELGLRWWKNDGGTVTIYSGDSREMEGRRCDSEEWGLRCIVRVQKYSYFLKLIPTIPYIIKSFTFHHA